MANLSQQKRLRMLEFLQTIREEHKNDDDVLAALSEIESELNAKNMASYGNSMRKPYIYRCAIIFLYLQNAQIKKSLLIQAETIISCWRGIISIVYDCWKKRIVAKLI